MKNSTLKRLSVYIAIGSVIIGVMICLWPVECEHNVIATCFNRLEQIMQGLFILCIGILLSILIKAANTSHYILSITGIITNFILAVLALVSSMCIGFFIGSNIVDLIISIVLAMQGLGFFCAGLSANAVKDQ